MCVEVFFNSDLEVSDCTTNIKIMVLQAFCVGFVGLFRGLFILEVGVKSTPCIKFEIFQSSEITPFQWIDHVVYK